MQLSGTTAFGFPVCRYLYLEVLRIGPGIESEEPPECRAARDEAALITFIDVGRGALLLACRENPLAVIKSVSGKARSMSQM